MNKRDIYSHT